jgi:hypothetical protein
VKEEIVMTSNKKSMLMVGAAAVSLCALGLVVVAGGNQSVATVNATMMNKEITFNSTSGFQESDADPSKTYTWISNTYNGYHIAWSGTGLAYQVHAFACFASGHSGEFHNTITLHQITGVTLSQLEAVAGQSYTLLLYTSSNGTDWSTAPITLTSGVAQSLSASDNIGFVKFVYDTKLGTTMNDVETVKIYYNCIA